MERSKSLSEVRELRGRLNACASDHSSFAFEERTAFEMARQFIQGVEERWAINSEKMRKVPHASKS